MKIIKRLFWSLEIVFVFIILQFFVIQDLIHGPIFLLPLIVFCLLGSFLFFKILKSKLKGKLRFFFLLTSVSASLFFVFVFLHNFIYGLLIILFGESFWSDIGMADEPVFFILAIIVCPLVFLFGSVGSFYHLAKLKKGGGK